MISLGKHRIRNHMSMIYNFSGIRILNGSLIPVDWSISVDLVALERKGLSIEESEFQATVSYQKLFFWLDTNLPNIIMVDVTEDTDLYIANLSSNIMMYCPSLPYDDVISELLHSKLSALAEENLHVGELRIKGSDMSVQYSFDCVETGYNLPESTEDYYSEGLARDAAPWWMRNDGFSFEFIRPADTKLSDEELYKDITDPLDEFYKFISDASDKYIGAAREPATIVQVERWKPKMI